MQRFKYAFLLWGCIITLALLTAQSSSVEAAAPKQGPHKTPPAPAASTTVVSTLLGTTALSSSSVWAVGTTMNIPQFTGQPLIEHWDGNKWLIVPGPTTPSNELSTLIGATAITNTDAWAVGFSMNVTKLTGQVLIEHWDGNNWQVVPGPTNVKPGGLSAITALGPNNIWAVGSTDSASSASSEALILHWDGNNWQTIPAASTTGASNLLSISAVSANNIWAVGETFTTKESKALIEHWDGSNWQVMPAPASSMDFNKLSAVAAISNNNIWIVGNSFSQPSQVSPFIDHWNGSTWDAVSTSDLPPSFLPTTISARNADDIWIAGGQALAHWNVKGWQSFPVASQKDFKLFNAITALAHDNAWVVGSSLETNTIVPLVEHWNGSSWQVIPNPAPAFKKATPSNVITNPVKHK